MQIVHLPKALCDRKCSKFVYGINHRYVHRPSNIMEINVTPKKTDGPGLRSSRHINKSFMMKGGWNLYHKSQDSWI